MDEHSQNGVAVRPVRILLPPPSPKLHVPLLPPVTWTSGFRADDFRETGVQSERNLGERVLFGQVR